MEKIRLNTMSIPENCMKDIDTKYLSRYYYAPRSFFRYELIYQSKKSMARVSKIHTPHGIIDTPSYVAVATNGALKGLDLRESDAASQQLMFCNSYHLMVNPGPDVIKGAGGLHSFINRQNQPLITDSGGFQIFSLAHDSVPNSLITHGELKKKNPRKFKKINYNHRKDQGRSQLLKVTENGVMFKSYRDGKNILLTPESTVQAQKIYGADIIIPLDQLAPYYVDNLTLQETVERSHRWETRSLKEHLKNVNNQAIYSVIHGGIDICLRKKSIEYLASLPFDGYAIGGSLGKTNSEMSNLLKSTMPLLDKGHGREKPRHLLGVGDEANIIEAIRNGIDTLDSCYPTRLSRHGTLLTRYGAIRIRSSQHAKSYGIPIDPECSCSTCLHYDRPYLCHLFKAKEPLFLSLAAIHNIRYMNDFMNQIRTDILQGVI